MIFDVNLNFQKFRHSRIASWIRRFLYERLVGSQDWPPTFRAVKDPQLFLSQTSPHIYVHIPFCKTICHHCPYNKSLFQVDVYSAYRSALIREIQNYLNNPFIPPIHSLYFGGGTPSMLPELVGEIIDLFKDRFVSNCEVGIEVHPSDASQKTLQQLKNGGVNRVSLGIETFSPHLLKKVGRTYTPEQAEDAIHRTVKMDFSCTDANLIYGIPGQSVQDSVEDAKRCIALGVNHLSAYPLISFEHTPLGRRVERHTFPHYGRRMRLRAQREIADECFRHGFNRTSVWSFTGSNQSGYSTVTREHYRGFGAGAGSKIGGLFWFNTFSLPEYSKLQQPRPAIFLQHSERFRRFHWLYWQIYRTKIDGKEYRQEFERALTQDFGKILQLMQWMGWILKKQDEEWDVTERGAIWAHQMQMLYSLTYIDSVWSVCQQEAWPEEIILR